MKKTKEKEMIENKGPLWYWNFQGLSRKEGDRSLFPHGRGWLFFRSGFHIGLEWSFKDTRSLGISFSFASEEDDLDFSIKIPYLFALYFSAEKVPGLHRLFYRIRRGFGYKSSIEIRSDSIWVHVLYNEPWGASRLFRWLPNWLSSWQAFGKDGGFGFYFCFHFWDMLFGRRQYSEELIGEPVILPVSIHPDSFLGIEYQARVQMKRATWKRSRWPRAESILRAEIECLTPIPIPGKGESEWDQGDDATFEFITPARSPEEGVGSLIRSIHNRRREYGLPDSIESLYRGIYSL